MPNRRFPVAERLETRRLLYSVGGLFFDDVNGSGARDSGEVVMPGQSVKVYKYDRSNVPGPLLQTVTSGSDGRWITTVNLQDGIEYYFEPQPIAGRIFTGISGYALTNSGGSSVTNYDFATSTNSLILGRVFNDFNGNGQFDTGDTGQGGVKVYLDADNDGEFDTGERFATTVSFGEYRFGGLTANTYVVRVVAPVGQVQTSPANGDGRVVNFASTPQRVSSQDFRLFDTRQAAISGQIFYDFNLNGARDFGETNLSIPRTVYLDLNDDGSLTLGEPNARTSNGYFGFTGLAAGQYRLRQIVESGWVGTNPPGNDAILIDLPQNGSRTVELGQRLAVEPTGQVVGEVFNDANDNGQRDTGETARVGATLFLDKNNNGAHDLSTEPYVLTDQLGRFIFTGVNPGTYAIRQMLGAGSQQTTPGGSAAAVVQIVAGEQVSGVRFGVGKSTTAGSISGLLFNDQDRDGEQDTNEPPLSGRSVYLDLNGNDALDLGEPAIATPSNGRYAFTNLAAGSYTVRVVTSPTDQITWPVAGESTFVYSGTGNQVAVVFFAIHDLTQFATISGRLYEDYDNDGTYDAGESFRSGVTVYADLDGNGSFGSGDVSTTTDSFGNYSLKVYNDGNYRAYDVRVVPPSQYVVVTPASGLQTRTLLVGQTASGADFGLRRTTAAIRGYVYLDTNNDGTPDSSAAGRTVYLDTDNDGSLDTGEPTAVTDSYFGYSFDDLTPGAYTVRQIVPAGLMQISPANNAAQVVSVIAGQYLTAVSFINAAIPTPTGATASGVVFVDANRNKLRDVGEFGSNDFIVYLDLDNDKLFDPGEQSMRPLGDGTFTLSNIPPASSAARLRVLLTGSVQQSLPTSGYGYALNTSAGAVNSGLLFGVYPPPAGASASGSVFVDANRNGKQDSGEAGYLGATVWFDLDNDKVIDATEQQVATGETGTYSMANISPAASSARLRVLLPGGYAQTLPTNGNGYALGTAAGATNTAKHFGIYTAPAPVRASVSGKVFRDDDRNGRQNGAEPGLSGLVVWFDLDNDKVRDTNEQWTTTLADGSYAITNIAPASSAARVRVQPGNLTQIAPTNGFGWSINTAAGATNAAKDFALAAPVPRAVALSAASSPFATSDEAADRIRDLVLG